MRNLKKNTMSGDTTKTTKPFTNRKHERYDENWKNIGRHNRNRNIVLVWSLEKNDRRAATSKAWNWVRNRKSVKVLKNFNEQRNRISSAYGWRIMAEQETRTHDLLKTAIVKLSHEIHILLTVSFLTKRWKTANHFRLWQCFEHTLDVGASTSWAALENCVKI